MWCVVQLGLTAVLLGNNTCLWPLVTGFGQWPGCWHRGAPTGGPGGACWQVGKLAVSKLAG